VETLRRGWEEFSSNTRFEVEDDSNIRFSDDLWCGDWTLKEPFPDLFGIARTKDGYVIDNLNVSFIRVAHDWEVNILSFFKLLYSFRLG
jgi:hypothetical protein